MQAPAAPGTTGEAKRKRKTKKNHRTYIAMIAAVKKRGDDTANDPFQQTQQFTAYGELKGLGLKTAITVERKLLSVHQGDNNFSCCEGKKKKKE